MLPSPSFCIFYRFQGYVVGGYAIVLGEHSFYRIDDAEERDFPGEEGGYRYLVGGVEHGRVRCGFGNRLAGQIYGRECYVI